MIVKIRSGLMYHCPFCGVVFCQKKDIISHVKKPFCVYHPEKKITKIKFLKPT